MRQDQNTALIIGTSRGLGLAMAAEFARRGWLVIATVRAHARTPTDELAERCGGRISVERLDVTDLAGLRSLRRQLDGRILDLLFVNAGVINSEVDATMVDVPDEEYTRLMLTNALAPIRALELLQDLVREDGVIGAMSSGLGSLAENAAGTWPAYASSKAALNMLLHNLAARHGRGRAIVAMTPGWVRTDMGGHAADLSVEESVPRVVDVLSRTAGRHGLHYLSYDGRILGW